MSKRTDPGSIAAWIYIGALIVALIVASCMGKAQAQSIPEGANAHRADMQRSAWRVFGPGAPTATLAAQIHAESTWRIDARSPVGAQGLAQFMPSTAADMARRYPGICAPANPFSPRWAFACRDRYLQTQLQNTVSTGDGLSECARWQFALRRYNGGAGWIIKDRRLAAAHGADPDSPEQVAQFNAGRSSVAFGENTAYAPKIMALQARYHAAGWGAQVCD